MLVTGPTGSAIAAGEARTSAATSASASRRRNASEGTGRLDRFISASDGYPAILVFARSSARDTGQAGGSKSVGAPALHLRRLSLTRREPMGGRGQGWLRRQARRRRASDKGGAHDQEETRCGGHAAIARTRRDPDARIV